LCFSRQFQETAPDGQLSQQLVPARRAHDRPWSLRHKRELVVENHHTKAMRPGLNALANAPHAAQNV
jgi:hypothetical protein